MPFIRLFSRLLLLSLVGFPLLLSAQQGSSERGTGLLFDLQSYRGAPYKATLTAASYAATPPTASLEAYCPRPGDQGQFGTCVAFAVAYHARTILWGMENRVTNKIRLTTAAFSPTFVYEQIKSPEDTTCSLGSNPIAALELMKNVGTAPLYSVPYHCGGKVSDAAMLQATDYTITDYQTLFSAEIVDREVRVKSVKKSLAEGYPVVLGFIVTESFYTSSLVWRPTATDAGATGDHGRHAMVVVGYDDTRFGGAFRVLNSWGDKWADKGYVWIPYEHFAEYAICAIQVYGPRPKPAPPKPAPVPRPGPQPKPAPVVANYYLKGRVELALRDGTVMPSERVEVGETVGRNAASAEKLTAYRVKESHPSGTRFRFFITTNTEAYLYAFATDLTGKVTRILPFEDGMSPLVGPDSTVAFPSETKVVRMDNQPGSDFLLVLYTDKPFDTNAALAAMQGTPGGLSAQIKKALGNRLLNSSEIAYSANQIAFDVQAFSPGRIVPLMIEIPHH